MFVSEMLTIFKAITGLQKAYSFGPDVSPILAVIAVGLTGDPIAETWSIGGPYPASLGGALLSNSQGISWSHNSYESDASATRVSSQFAIYISDCVTNTIDCRAMLT